MDFRKLVLVFLYLHTIFCFAQKGNALQPYLYENPSSYHHLSENFQYFEDCDNSSSQEIFNHLLKGDFQKPIQNATFNKGFTMCTYWLAVSIKNTSKEKKKLLWSFYNNGLEFQYYEVQKSTLKLLQTSSMHNPLKDRPYPVRSISFPIHLDSNEDKTVMVKVSTTTHQNIYFPTDITEVEDYLLYEVDFSFLIGKYFGIFLVVILSNLFFFLILKDRIYLYTVLYVFFSFLFLLSDYHFDSLELHATILKYWSYINQNIFIILSLFFLITIFQIFTVQREEFPKQYFYLKNSLLTD
jgi:hypothetical protein